MAKKIIAVLLILAMVFSLAACGGTVQVNDSELAVEIVRVAKAMIS